MANFVWVTLFDGRQFAVNTDAIESVSKRKPEFKNTTVRTLSGDELELKGDVTEQLAGKLYATPMIAGFPEVQRIAVLSTGHMTEEDDRILRELESKDMVDIGRKPSWLDATEFGHRIRVNGDDFPDEFAFMENGLGLSGSLQHVLREAHASGFDEVVFDCDGPVSDVFVNFEW